MMAVYRVLLRLYPKSFRRSFAGEMLETLSRVEMEKANRGSLGRTLAPVREIYGLLKGIAAEQLGFNCSRADCPLLVAANEAAELEERVRFHLAQTLDCIAHHNLREHASTREKKRRLDRS